MPDVWDRFVGVGEVLVEPCVGRLLRCKPALLIQKKRLGPRLLRRPVLEPAPLIRSRFKDPGFRKLPVAFGFQMVQEEWKFDPIAEIRAGLGTEVDITDAVAVPSRKTAMRPRSHHEKVDRRRRILLHELMLTQRSLQVLVVEPAAHEHDRRFDGGQILPDGPRLPNFIVGSVLHVQRPIRMRAFEVLLVGIG